MATPTLDKAEAGFADSPYITVTFRIRRFNPEISDEASWQDFQVEIDPKERVLDGLHKIKWDLDGSLTFRRSCAHGICGSDAMRINGKNRLACKTLIKDLSPEKPITVEAIKGLTVLKDLVVDMDPFFQAYRDVMPFLITKGNEPTRERLQSPEDRERFDDTTKCILCAACTSSCPVFWNDGQYFGPAAIVNAHRFIFDSRDEAAEQRLEILNDKDGVALPHHVQLHGRLPAWHRGHQGDPGSQARADHASLLTFRQDVRARGPRHPESVPGGGALAVSQGRSSATTMIRRSMSLSRSRSSSLRTPSSRYSSWPRTSIAPIQVARPDSVSSTWTLRRSVVEGVRRTNPRRSSASRRPVTDAGARSRSVASCDGVAVPPRPANLCSVSNSGRSSAKSTRDCSRTRWRWTESFFIRVTAPSTAGSRPGSTGSHCSTCPSVQSRCPSAPSARSMS